MKKKVLFIPADVIKNEVSRSFYFARYLSDHYDLYFLTRLDPQNAYFEKKKRSKFFTLSCFIKSVFTRTTYSRHDKWGFSVVRVPFMSHMVIHRILGMVNALKVCRKFNGYYLKKVASATGADIIFHADGFDMYPALNNYVSFSDFQDDFDKGNFRDNDYNRMYVKEQLQKANKNFVVSQNAAQGLSKVYDCDFVYIPNGVEIKAMQKIDRQKLERMKDELRLKGKFVVTYIGADAWYEQKLIREVFDLALKKDPSIHFLIVGNLPVIPSPNASFTGPVSKDDSYYYYWLSDAGILFKDSKGSKFLYNSIPLKIIQYGVTNKWFVSPPIAWLEDGKFTNIELLPEFTPQNIVNTLLEMKKKLQPTFDETWNSYDWQEITGKIHQEIESVKAI